MFAARRTQRSTRPLASSVIGIAIIAITGMQLMSTLDGTIVVVALPRMQAELGLSDAAKSWVITAYVLTFGGLLLLGGRVGDAIGHKRAFIAGVGVFTAASLVCGVAFDPAMLIVARAVQGIGAAVAAPTGLALIASTYAVGQARNQAMAVSAAMLGIGSVLGLVLGGAFTVISWRLAFLINVAIGIVILAMAGAPPRTAAAGCHRRGTGDAGLQHSGAGVHAGPAAGLGQPVGDRRRGGDRAAVRRIPRGGGRGREPACAAFTVHQPQPGDDVRIAVPGRRRAAHADRDDRPVRAVSARLLGAEGRRLFHSV